MESSFCQGSLGSLGVGLVTGFEFEWDPKKAASNLHKHKVSFEDAKFAFANPLEDAQINSVVNGEERWQIIGVSRNALPILVIFTPRNKGEVIRIISARRLIKRDWRKL